MSNCSWNITILILITLFLEKSKNMLWTFCFNFLKMHIFCLVILCQLMGSKNVMKQVLYGVSGEKNSKATLVKMSQTCLKIWFLEIMFSILFLTIPCLPLMFMFQLPPCPCGKHWLGEEQHWGKILIHKPCVYL